MHDPLSDSLVPVLPLQPKAWHCRGLIAAILPAFRNPFLISLKCSKAASSRDDERRDDEPHLNNIWVA